MKINRDLAAACRMVYFCIADHLRRERVHDLFDFAMRLWLLETGSALWSTLQGTFLKGYGRM